MCIRDRVFTEVARMAYANVKGEQANHLMRKIPYTIIPMCIRDRFWGMRGSTSTIFKVGLSIIKCPPVPPAGGTGGAAAVSYTHLANCRTAQRSAMSSTHLNGR